MNIEFLLFNNEQKIFNLFQIPSSLLFGKLLSLSAEVSIYSKGDQDVVQIPLMYRLFMQTLLVRRTNILYNCF